MLDPVFANINKIIERDSKATTYKFALLRGVIDIIQDNTPFIRFSEDRVIFPTGLLIEKWMIYYYPILESDIPIPQINGEINLAFSPQFHKIIASYKDRNGFSAFFNDLKNKGIPKDLYEDFLLLSKQIFDTIVKMPMKYIGRSISNELYSIFNYSNGYGKLRPYILDSEYLIENFGTFSIPLDYYQAFKILGSFINGQDSILFKWAAFSVNASRRSLSTETVINQVLKSPVTEREIQASRRIYDHVLKKEGKVYCVWTGKQITKFDIDHVIPFSIWKNNNLWNLLPSQKSVNIRKRDKIPAVAFLGEQQELIFHYWHLLNEAQPIRFQKEIRFSLLGNETNKDWKQLALKQLQKSCDYLISERGYEEWSI